MSVYKLVPVAVPKPWGGGHLDHFSSGGKKIGELVLVSDLENFPVKAVYVLPGNQEEILFSQLYKNLLNSQEKPGQNFPFMIKILSTGEPLSVQNHPADEDLEKLGLKGKGKFESWVILSAEPNATLYLGLREKYTKDILRDMHTLENPLAVLREITPVPGKIYLLNPGLIHATQGKIMFYEIQQSSDHTFRIYDFGRPRELNIDNALKVFRNPPVEVRDENMPLNTPAFQLESHLVKELFTHKCNRKFEILTWLGNHATFSHSGYSLSLQWADTFFLTNNSEIEIRIEESAVENKVCIAYE